MRIKSLVLFVLFLFPVRLALSSEPSVTLVCTAPHQSAQTASISKLCDLLAKSLVQNGLQVARADVVPPGRDQNVIWLVVDRLSGRLVSGRLEWRQAGAVRASVGPQIETIISDSELNDSALGHFINGLVAESKLNFGN